MGLGSQEDGPNVPSLTQSAAIFPDLFHIREPFALY